MLYRSILVAGFVGGSHALRIRKEEPKEKLTTALVETNVSVKTNDSDLQAVSDSGAINDSLSQGVLDRIRTFRFNNDIPISEVQNNKKIKIKLIFHHGKMLHNRSNW